MKTLSLLRHANADSPPASADDFARPLSAFGQRQARYLGEQLASSGFFPDLVLSSAARRTSETAQGMADCLGAAIVIKPERDLYLADAEQILNFIQQADDSVNHLMIVGHNPGISELAHRLSRGTLSDHVTEVSPATLINFDANIISWTETSPLALTLAGVVLPLKS